MIKITSLFTLFFTFCSLQVSALKVSCEDMVENNPVKAVFDSSAPIFVSEVQVSPTKYIQRQHFTNNSVCGMTLNFAKNCQSKLQSSNSDMQYQFKCNNGVHATLELISDSVIFNCEGPGVTDDDQNIILTGCKISQ